MPAASPSLKMAMRRGSAGGGPEARPLPDERHAVNIGGRFAGDVSLPDEGHGTRFGGRREECQRRVLSQMDRHAVNIRGGSIAASLSLTEATGRGLRGECRRRILPPDDRHAVNIGGRIDRGSLPLTEATG